MIQLALGWTILHSVWEGAMVALLLAAAFSVLRSARARYAAACLAMLSILAGFVFTMSRALQPGTVTAAPLALRIPPVPLDGAERAHGVPVNFSASAVLPWLATLWVAGVILFHLYSLASWMAARRMLRRGVCKPPEIWQHRIGRLCERLRLATPVTLLESCLTVVPVVIGYLRPVVLVPVGLLTGMSPAMCQAQIEAVLLHELAHIRRRDYLVNLLQTVVEGFLFYHPAVWWISGVIRAERENCCDDLVVAVSGNAHEYASALAALERTRWSANDAALAANGGNLMKRIRRLLYPLEAPRAVLSPALSAIILTATAALALTAWQAKSQENPSASHEQNPYKQWAAQDVAYIITDKERNDFENLQTDAQREQFIEQFWLRRDPTPDTVRNEFKEEHYRRIAYANDHFASSLPGWKTDRGRIYITYGPPDEIESHPRGGEYQRPTKEGGGEVKTYPFEEWRYRLIDGVGENVIIEFVDPEWKGEFHMTRDPNEKVVPK